MSKSKTRKKTKKTPATRRTTRFARKAPLKNLRVTRRKVATALDKNRVRALALIADLKKRESRVVDDFYYMGQALAELSEPRLYTSLGYKSFGDLLRRQRLVARATAHRLITVAQTYTRREAHSLGLRKAYAITRFVAATPQHDLARKLVKQDAKIAGHPISALSARQIDRATQQVRRTAGHRPRQKSEAQKTAERTARELQRSLRSEGARTARVTATRDGAEYRLHIDIDVADASLILGE